MALTLPILNARVVQERPSDPRVQVQVVASDGEVQTMSPLWLVEVEGFGALAICDTEREAQAVLAALDLEKLLERIGRRLALKSVN